MRARGVVSLVLLVGGAGLIVDAIARGGASVALVVVFPVVFGASAEFFLGVVLLFLGFVTLPFAFGYTFATEEAEDGAPRSHHEVPPQEVGGLLLIGPVPIFFGRWGHVRRRTRVLAALAGAALLVAAVAVFLWLR
jgi:uncharacterized membrane protein